MESTQLFNLAGKVALVTGASRGIGEAAATILAKQGAHVVISSRKLEGCEAVAGRIIEAGGSAEAFPCHIGDLDQIQAITDHIKTKHNQLDILVNNAATNPYFGPILDTDLGAYEKTVDVNIRGYFFMSIAAAKIMQAGGGGSIINIASINGRSPGPWQGVYSITKAAVINMTQAFAKECVSDNIRVNAIAPGLTATKLAGAIVDDANILSTIPMARAAQPEEMCGAILYLASSASSYCTGSVITVDGGLLA